jgi:aminopeptidase YwaD
MTDLAARAAAHMQALTAFSDRHLGGEGNLAATLYFAQEMRALGYAVIVRDLPCLEWWHEGASLAVGDLRPQVLPGPYSLACVVTAPLVAASTIEELEGANATGAILLLHGELAQGMYMPRNYRFYNPESHKRVYRALDALMPDAVLGATSYNPEMVGAQYPFPLFADGDLDIPNAYLRDVDGEDLLAHVGESVRLTIESGRRQKVAEQVTAHRSGHGEGRLLLTAHIDSWFGSPGALDNASGVATLLLAAELLAGYDGRLGLEFVPFNGEDDYSAAGELQWLAENEGRLGDIVLNINLDDSGQLGADNAVSFYGCPPETEAILRNAMSRYPEIEEGPQWFQGDHAIMAQRNVPAVAIGSSDMVAFMAEHAHTPHDSLELADFDLMASTARFLAEVVMTSGTEAAGM